MNEVAFAAQHYGHLTRSDGCHVGYCFDAESTLDSEQNVGLIHIVVQRE